MYPVGTRIRVQSREDSNDVLDGFVVGHGWEVYKMRWDGENREAIQSKGYIEGKDALSSCDVFVLESVPWEALLCN